MTSAAFSIGGVSVPQSSGKAIETTYGATVTLTLDSVTGAEAIEWTIAGVSGAAVASPAITRSGTPLGATATFSVAADAGAGAGVAYGVRCRVTDGNGDRVESWGVVGVPNIGGAVPGVAGEGNTWRHATVGWTPLFNDALMGFPYYAATVTTTGSTAATASTVTIPAGKIAMIDAVWSAYDVTAGDRLLRQSVGVFYCDAAGTAATQLGSTSDVFNETTDATWATTMAVSGSGVAIGYAGDATNSTDWRLLVWRTMPGN